MKMIWHQAITDKRESSIGKQYAPWIPLVADNGIGRKNILFNTGQKQNVI
jgi:hypothetical protein